MGCKSHCNLRSQRLEQATFGAAHRVIDDIWDHIDKEATRRRRWKEEEDNSQTTSKEEEEVEEEKESEEDENLALIIRKFNKF